MSSIESNKIKTLILGGFKLQAVKLHRDATGVTLQESLAHVNSLEEALKSQTLKHSICPLCRMT